ncbi:hypothetical protein TNCV_371831 [Trichonephila clavipes]|nr:hypothetical protein TNCV_371831 [Trichonephila clavipes]
MDLRIVNGTPLGGCTRKVTQTGVFPITQPSQMWFPTLTYANPELRNFRISPDSFFPFNTETQTESVSEPDENGNMIEVVVYFAIQINLEVDNYVVQELLNTHNDELIEMHEHGQDIQEL